MTEPLRILSLGGGTQSWALAFMSARGDIDRLDHIVFADTHGELPETYEYLDYGRRIVEAAGIPLHIVSAGSLEQALLATEPTSHNPTPPAHVLNPDGSKGRIGAYRCSYDYKRRQVTRKAKALCGNPGDWKRSNVEQWIGFSLEETGRMKDSTECRCGHNRITGRGKTIRHIHTDAGCTKCRCEQYEPWQTNRWPLIELRMKRQDTIAWFGQHGHPTPPRSACYFCPNSSNERWISLRRDHPDLFDRAVHLDTTIRNGGGFNARGNIAFAGQMFLHASLLPLREAIDAAIDPDQRSLFDDDALAMDCNAGVCFT